MKSLLPWLCALGLLGGVVFLSSSNQRLTREVAELRQESSQVQEVRAELEQLKTTSMPAQAEQIAQLRRDNQDLLKLRKEVRQLREDKKQLSQQAQAAQTEAQAAQSHAIALSADLQAVQTAAQQPTLITPQQQWVNACINNLRQLDGAKQQWALEGKKEGRDIPTEREITEYLKDGIPKCPAGGVYTLGSVEVVPTCSVAGHALPE